MKIITWWKRMLFVFCFFSTFAGCVFLAAALLQPAPAENSACRISPVSGGFVIEDLRPPESRPAPDARRWVPLLPGLRLPEMSRWAWSWGEEAPAEGARAFAEGAALTLIGEEEKRGELYAVCLTADGKTVKIGARLFREGARLPAEGKEGE